MGAFTHKPLQSQSFVTTRHISYFVLQETSTEVSIFTRHAVQRLMRFAFETAQKRPKKHITVVTKSNAQRNGMVMWDEIANEVKQEFPDVQMDKMLVDAMTCRMVLQPQSLDTIVATNLVSLPQSLQ